MTRQPTQRGRGRKRLSTAVLRQLDAWVRTEARQHQVSLSFVIAVAVSHASGIPIDGYTTARKR